MQKDTSTVAASLDKLFPAARPETIAILDSLAKCAVYDAVNALVPCAPDETLLVIEGVIECVLNRRTDRFIVESLQPGDCLIGRHALENQYNRSARFTTILRIPSAGFQACLHRDADLSAAVLERLVARHTTTLQRMHDLVALETPDRVWKEIKRLATPNGAGLRSFRITQRHLAELVGSGRESVSRIMTKFIRDEQLCRYGSRRDRYHLPA